MYKIVSASKNSLCDAIHKVETEVNELKREGWVEQGGVSISHSIVHYVYAFDTEYYTVAQAMVKKEE